MTIGGRTRVALEREKALVLRSIKELEFDFAMGKIAKADFDEMSRPAARPRARPDAPARRRRRVQGTDRRKKWHASGGSRVIFERVSEGRWQRRPETRASRELWRMRDENDPDAKFCKNCGAKL